MVKITVLGGTGYTGGNIVREAAARGHDVTSFSRTTPAETVDGVRYETGSLLDDGVRQRAVRGADVVIGTLAPRGELSDQIETLYARAEELAAQEGARFGVVGGFSALRPAEGAPRIVEGDGIPTEYADEARAMHTVLLHLLDDAVQGPDWFYVSPAQNYGSYAPGTANRTYRIGGEVAIFDGQGVSAISGADFALAIVDEIEKPAHHRRQFSVAY